LRQIQNAKNFGNNELQIPIPARKTESLFPTKKKKSSSRALVGWFCRKMAGDVRQLQAKFPTEKI
jgi:hypothetical protein